MLLRGHNIRSIDDIFDVLRPTYGLDEYFLQQQTKQQEEDSVRVYYGKLKTNLMLIGYSDTPAASRNLLATFVNGLLPDIRRTVKALKPQTIQNAVGIANETEVEQAETRKKKPVEHFNHLKEDTTSSNRFEKFMTDKLNAIDSRLAIQGRDQTSCNSNKWQPPQPKFSSVSISRYSRPCFGCGETGHNYMQCSRTSEDRKKAIAVEVQDFYLDARQKDPNDTRPNFDNFRSKNRLNA